MIDSWSLIAPIRNSVRGRTEHGKITITSGRRNLHSLTPTPLPTFQIYFSPQPSAAINIKDGGHNIRYEITEHSLDKITPALQARCFEPAKFLEKVRLFPAESFAKALKSYQSMVLSRACFLILSAH